MVIWHEHERLGRAVLGDDAYGSTYDVSDADTSESPSIFSAVKECRDWSTAGPAKRALIRDMAAVRKYRNDLFHGRAIAPTSQDIQDALDAFESIVSWVTAARPRQA